MVMKLLSKDALNVLTVDEKLQRIPTYHTSVIAVLINSFLLLCDFIFWFCFVLQRVAQVLDEFDDEDIGVGLIDAKLDKAVAKKLGKNANS